MKLTDDIKKEIDSMSYENLLSLWRFAPAGDKWFQGERGDYFSKRMADLRKHGADHVGASKFVGWEKESSHREGENER